MTHETARQDLLPREQNNDRLREMMAAFGPRFAGIVRQYRASLPGRIAAMEEGALLDAHDMLAVAAHRLGGSSASLGASEIAVLCRTLETLCSIEEKVPADWRQRLAAIARACDIFNERLDALELI